jgi:phage recombination protein Bet
MTTEIVRTGGALAVRPEQTEWTPEQAAVLQQSGISNEVTAAELSGFLHLCQRTQLDPFSRQIYLIGRFDKREGRKVFTPQTGIDGYRVIAHRVVAEHRHTFGYEDTQWCDAAGRWRDAWLATEPPAAAKVTVLRNGQRFSAVALYREYVQTNNYGVTAMWTRMPASQLAKCAEALALRKAFPHDLAGVYTAEEMAQADNPTPEERQPQRPEADPWPTAQPAAPDGNVAVKGRSQPAQDFADAATKATEPTAVRDAYRDANAAGLLTETVKVDRELLALGDYLIARGQQLKAPAPQQDAGTGETPASDVSDHDLARASASGYSAVEQEAQAEIDRRLALDRLRAAASAAGLTPADLDEGFKAQYTHTTAEGTVEELQAMTAVLTRGAA